MVIFSGRFARALGVFAGITLLTGCGDTNQGIKLAREFGQTADTFQEKTDKLANDIYASCVRGVRYDSLAATVLESADALRVQRLSRCDLIYKPTAQRAIQANQVVTDYIKAVGRLAGVNVQFQSDFAEINKALSELMISGMSPFNLDQQVVTQGIRIANAISDWMAARFRNVELSKAVICTNAPLQTYLDGLGTAYRKGYIEGILKDEQLKVVNYYNTLTVLQEGASRRANSAMSVRDYEALNSNSYEALMAIRNQQAAARGYIRILNLTGQANSQIASVFTKAGYPASPEQCAAYFAPSSGGASSRMSPSATYASRGLSLAEKAQIGQILLKYTTLIKHELDNIKL